MNPLFNAISGQAPQNGPAQIAQQFQQFKAQFSGNPQQMVQQLLASGRMTQAQYNQLAQSRLLLICLDTQLYFELFLACRAHKHQHSAGGVVGFVECQVVATSWAR